jgi:hypothetical protein
MEDLDDTIAETAPTGDDHDLETMIQRVRAATIAVVNGRPGPWLALCSHQPDATLFGGWGGHERGWEQLEPRYVWATARFAGGDVTFEELSRFVCADLAGTVHHERMRARLKGMADPASFVLRVTQLYRREEPVWRLIHRHADPLIEVQTPESVVDDQGSPRPT